MPAPMIIAAVIAAAVALITAAIAAGQEGEAQAIRKKMADQYGDGILPSLDKGVAEQVQKTAAPDDKLRRSQMEALLKLEGVYAAEGTTEADRAALELANDAVSGRASRDAAEANDAMAQQGLSNSGLAFAMQSQGSQNALSQLGTMARQNQVDARARALKALGDSAGLAGNIRGDDLAQASAQDRIAMFNADKRQEMNVRNMGLTQQEYDNRMLLLQARANALSGVAGGYERSAQGTRATGAGVGNAALTYGQWGEQALKDDKKGKGG